MTWTTPTLVEICIGLEINGYLPGRVLILGSDLVRAARSPPCGFIFAGKC